MGWLEVLSLLKRLAPALERLGPLLEAAIAGRSSSRMQQEHAAAQAGELQALRNLLEEGFARQHAELEALRQRLPASGELAGLQAAVEALERQVKLLQKLAGAVAVLLTVLLVAVFTLAILLQGH